MPFLPPPKIGHVAVSWLSKVVVSGFGKQSCKLAQSLQRNGAYSLGKAPGTNEVKLLILTSALASRWEKMSCLISCILSKMDRWKVNVSFEWSLLVIMAWVSPSPFIYGGHSPLLSFGMLLHVLPVVFPSPGWSPSQIQYSSNLVKFSLVFQDHCRLSDHHWARLIKSQYSINCFGLLGDLISIPQMRDPVVHPAFEEDKE